MLNMSSYRRYSGCEVKTLGLLKSGGTTLFASYVLYCRTFFLVCKPLDNNTYNKNKKGV